MIQAIRKPVRVFLMADYQHKRVRPYFIDWEQQRYEVKELGLYHWYRVGTRKIHVFSVNVGALDMRIEIDSETFECFLTEISDGLAD